MSDTRTETGRQVVREMLGEDFLQGLEAAAPTPAAPAPAAAGTVATGFTVKGSADSQIRVAWVLDRLSLLPWLSNVTLQSSVRQGNTPVQFTIGATIGSTGGR